MAARWAGGRWAVAAAMAVILAGCSVIPLAHDAHPPNAFPSTPPLLAGEQLPTVWPAPGPPRLQPIGAAVLTPSLLWVVAARAGGGSGIFRTDDGGQLWREQYRTGFPVTQLDFVGPHHGFAVENGCTLGRCLTSALLVTGDGGRRWHTVYATHAMRVAAVSFVSASQGYRLTQDRGGAAALAYTADGGATWSPRTVPCVPQSTRALSFVTRTTGFLACASTAAAGGATVVWSTTDGGAAWRRVAADIAGRPTGLAFLTAARGFLGTTRGLYGTRDAGRVWLPVGAPPILGHTPTTFVGRAAAQVYLLVEGRVWSLAPSARAFGMVYPAPAPRAGLAAVGRRLFGLEPVGAQTAVVMSRDGGRRWTLTGYLPAAATAVRSNGRGALWAVGPKLYLSGNDGRTWHATGSGAVVDAVGCGHLGWAIAPDGGLRVTRNNGRSFAPATRPPFQATGIACQGAGTVVALGPARVARVMVRTASSVSHVRVHPGVVYLWRSFGRDWVPYRLPPVLGMSPPTAVRFAGQKLGWMWSSNGYWVTDDGGTSWVARPVPSGVSISSLVFLSPGFAVMVADTGVFASATGGRSWTPLT
jgi:photosystem II stability/assembly factor-like uncharacterized protein